MSSDTPLRWTPEARAYLKRIPFFVRPLAKRRIETQARARGQTEITVELMDELKPKNMKA
jgi:hypothetical protein